MPSKSRSSFFAYNGANAFAHPCEASRLRLSNRSIAFISTWVPFAQSSGAQYSAGLWETPFKHGTKIIEVGHLLLVKTLSCPVDHSLVMMSALKIIECLPAPDVMSCTRRAVLFPSSAFAPYRTQSIQELSNLVAALGESRVHSTVHGRPLMLPFGRPSIGLPMAIPSKSYLSCCSMSIRTSSSAARISKLNWTQPGTVFVLPGATFMIPVLASALRLVAKCRECSIIFAAARSASARLAKSVVPL